MAGWLKRVDGSFPEGNECCCEKLKALFRHLLGESCFRPLPPRLGDGRAVDLLRLYLSVRERGGFESVSKSGRWDYLARECGFGEIAGSALKLVYAKYLGVLSEYLERVFEVRGSREVKQSVSECLFRLLMDLETDLKGCLSGTSPKKERNVGFGDVGFRKDVGFGLDGKLSRLGEGKGFPKMNGCAAVIVEKKIENADGGSDQVKRTNDPDTALEDVDGRKRKQESYSRMLTWISRVALDPCYPGIGSLPESPKWKHYADDLLWKQVLLARQAMQLKKENEMSDHQDATMQKKQKMHPTMYDDQSERQRYSQRIRAAKLTPRKKGSGIGFESSSSGTWSDDDPLESDTGDSDPNFVANRRRKKRVRIGPGFQANVPEWTGETYERDSKWLGTQAWPLEKHEQPRSLIERERIGKGRQDSCGCQFSGSLECIKFHVAEKKMRIKLELGPAYYRMSCESMGEEVTLSWAKEDQKKFQHIVESNPLSLGKCFWHEIIKSFPGKSTKSLVSYYYNVYLLRRRGQQNRITPHDINSDDDDDDSSDSKNNTAATAPGSIFCSPKKAPGSAR